MKLKFAPLNVPLNRRLQTLSAAFWIVSLIFGGVISWGFIIYFAFTITNWPLILLYFGWLYLDKETPYKGGRKSWIVRKFPLFKYFIEYFPISLAKTTDLPPDKNYLLCAYPHGVLSAGIFGNFVSGYSGIEKIFPKINFLMSTLDLHFNTPIFRDYLLALGAISSSKRSLEYLLTSENKGNAVILIVGGAAEAHFAYPGSHHIILGKRKGFIKVALTTGCSLVPVFSFGEVDLYDQVEASPGSKLARFQSWFKERTGVAAIIPKGRGIFQYSFGLLPRRFAVTTVVGKPIDVPLIENPTSEEIDLYHALFKHELNKLFEENKAKYLSNPDKVHLIID